MGKKLRCTCGGKGTCDLCVRDTYVWQSKPITDPVWRGKHPANPGTSDPDQGSRRGGRA